MFISNLVYNMIVKILLTGFEPFGDLKVNPSQVILEKISDRQTLCNIHQINTVTLPVDFESAGSKVKNAIQEFKPDIMLSLGLSETSHSITLETKAINLKQNVELQNSRIKGPKLILLGCPNVYKSTLPLDRMYRSLKDRNIPVTLSDNAGRYVCNYVFYLACHQIKLLENRSKAGFIHVPLMSEQILESNSNVPSLPLNLMVEAIESCIETIISVL